MAHDSVSVIWLGSESVCLCKGLVPWDIESLLTFVSLVTFATKESFGLLGAYGVLGLGHLIVQGIDVGWLIVGIAHVTNLANETRVAMDDVGDVAVHGVYDAQTFVESLLPESALQKPEKEKQEGDEA